MRDGLPCGLQSLDTKRSDAVSAAGRSDLFGGAAIKSFGKL